MNRPNPKPIRRQISVGRMGIVQTEKKAGDWVWCPFTRSWKVVK